MSSIVIGTSGGRNVAIDLNLLLPTRLLITADSGGGKSYLIRLILERVFGKLQSIVIDPEGEFATLREKFPFVLVGKGGETPADIRSAKLLAERLLELHASAVCDLYEMKAHLRHAWIKTFLDALIEAPKNLRTPVLVVVDEAHVYCPEKGESEAFGSMVDLATRGRKRGLCACFATQRLAMLSKDASSQLQNRLIGPTFEDVNRKRAAEILGLPQSGAEFREFSAQMQQLEPGNFYALGRAISKTRILVKIAKVETSHPKAFEKHSTPAPATPEKIKSLLPKMADLPREAEDKARTEAEFRAEIRALKAQIGKPAAAPAPAGMSEADVRRAIAAAVRPYQDRLATIQKLLNSISTNLTNARDAVGDLSVSQSSPAPVSPRPPAIVPRSPSAAGAHVASSPATTLLDLEARPASSNGDGPLPRAERMILTVLATHGPCEKNKCAILAGYAADAGGFNNPVSKMRKLGWITPKDVTPIRILDAGLHALGTPAPLPEGRELFEFWRGHNSLGHADREILRVLSESASPLSKEDLASRTASPKGTPYIADSGAFNNPLSRLRTLGLIHGPGSAIDLAPQLRSAVFGEVA